MWCWFLGRLSNQRIANLVFADNLLSHMSFVAGMVGGSLIGYELITLVFSIESPIPALAGVVVFVAGVSLRFLVRESADEYAIRWRRLQCRAMEENRPLDELLTTEFTGQGFSHKKG
ncbi:hypothetical protein GCM10023116_21620 [Kistimonas scapharcae]|uniref:Uncharacterized protein n=1 Tax=Kistimonas scapharcae TaxID=1036133 RepID=A0ABP8V3Q0_9GAMM